MSHPRPCPRKSAVLGIVAMFAVACTRDAGTDTSFIPRAFVASEPDAPAAPEIPPALVVEAPPPAPSATGIPPRPDRALSGSAFMRQTAPLPIKDREDRIRAELIAGNVPAFLRHWVPVHLAGTGPDGKAHQAWVWVLPDYLAIGGDDDFVRIPATPVTAQAVADRYGAVLVTPALVDAIYRHAMVKLKPIPMTPGKRMRSNSYIATHNGKVEEALAGWGHDALVAGHKKDVVLTNRLEGHPKRVAIYGWHEDFATPIQPLSIWHRKTYMDYSHGVRLVHQDMVIDGNPWKVADAMRHETMSFLLSEEGPLRETRVTPEGLEWDRDELRAEPMGRR